MILCQHPGVPGDPQESEMDLSIDPMEFGANLRWDLILKDTPWNFIAASTDPPRKTTYPSLEKYFLLWITGFYRSQFIFVLMQLHLQWWTRLLGRMVLLPAHIHRNWSQIRLWSHGAWILPANYIQFLHHFVFFSSSIFYFLYLILIFQNYLHGLN